MSSILSASSSTRYWMPFTSTATERPAGGSSRSFSRPGVATTTCGRCRNSASCGPLGAPPYRHTARIPATSPNCLASCSIWHASSRVGASTSMAGGPLGSAWLLNSLAKAGSRKASVLPEPVFAIPIRSRPSMQIGHAYCCIKVGAGKPAVTSGERTRGGNATSSQERQRPGTSPEPRTSTSCSVGALLAGCDSPESAADAGCCPS
mmetsp:Transcript_45894/g.132932  ORF Transcript_45894/g.132932 Transcript_45894/m.132932 type:complete len:206 (+) Transcript_45894:898-1515(+)